VTADRPARDRRRSRRRATPSADDAALGIVVVTARVALAGTRLLARAPGVAPFLERTAATGRAARVRGRERIESAAQTALAAPEVGRIVDGALAGPLPETVARSSIEHHVGDRVAAELEPERERLLQQLLDSPEFDQALQRALSSPRVREAIAMQTTTLAEEIIGDVRRRLVGLDERLSPRPADPSMPFAGLWSRGAAFAVDLVFAHVIFLVATALVGLVGSLVGDLRPVWLFGALAGGGWMLLVGGYFAFFWTLGGQTPGMRLLHLRVIGRSGQPLGLGRALLRFVALLLAIIPLFAGLLPILFDGKRRGLQDFVAQTIVLYAD
jgi:uncharacterized RDD family membrane protein YckC